MERQTVGDDPQVENAPAAPAPAKLRRAEAAAGPAGRLRRASTPDPTCVWLCVSRTAPSALHGPVAD